MLADRYPVPQRRKFERLLNGLTKKVKALETRSTLVADPQGRVRIGDVYLVQAEQDDGSIILLAQNANTLGPAIAIGVLQ